MGQNGTENENVGDQPGNPMFCIAYLRVSTDDKGQTTEQQKQIIEAQGWQIKEIFDDVGTSAKATDPWDRPVFIKAVKAAKAQGLPLVMAWVSRFSRQGIAKHFAALARLKVELHFCDNPEGDELYEAILAWKAHRETEDISSRVKAKIKADPSAKGGRPTKGFTVTEMEQLKQWKAQGKSYQAMAKALTEQRVGHILDNKCKTYKQGKVSKETVRKALNHLHHKA